MHKLTLGMCRYVLVLFVVNMLLNAGMGIGGGLFDYYYAQDSPYLTVGKAALIPFVVHCFSFISTVRP